jgi:hypothetical protein
MPKRRWDVTFVTLALSLAAGCAPRGEAAVAAPTEPAPAADPSLVCLPRASCGCFGQECVAGRSELGADGRERFRVEGAPPDALPGSVTEVCPNTANGLTECIRYVDLAQTCTVTCSIPPDLFSDPGYRCGFRDGVCGRL